MNHLQAREFIRARDPIRAIMADRVDPPPIFCRCDDPSLIEVTTFGESQAHYLCKRCGHMLAPEPMIATERVLK